MFQFRPSVRAGLAAVVLLIVSVTTQAHAQAPAWPLDGPAFTASVEDIQKAAAKTPPEKFMEATVHFEWDSYTLDPQGRVTYRHSMIFRIETQAGVEDWSESM